VGGHVKTPDGSLRTRTPSLTARTPPNEKSLLTGARPSSRSEATSSATRAAEERCWAWHALIEPSIKKLKGPGYAATAAAAETTVWGRSEVNNKWQANFEKTWEAEWHIVWLVSSVKRQLGRWLSQRCEAVTRGGVEEGIHVAERVTGETKSGIVKFRTIARPRRQ
jgi:hypothetical protein